MSEKLPPVEWVHTNDATQTKRPPTGSGFEKARQEALEFRRKQRETAKGQLIEKARRYNAEHAKKENQQRSNDMAKDSGKKWMRENRNALQQKGWTPARIKELDALANGGATEAEVISAAFQSRSKAPAVHTKKHEYSIGRAIDKQRWQRLDGLEKEMHDEVIAQAGDSAPERAANSIWIPHAALLRNTGVQHRVLAALERKAKYHEGYAAKLQKFQRAIEVGGTPGGWFHEQLDENYLIEALFAAPNFLGECTVMDKMAVQDVVVPIESNTTASYWTTEGTPGNTRAESSPQPSYGDFQFQWKQINTRIDTTQRALDQSRNFEMRIFEVMKRDVVRGVNEALLSFDNVTNGVASIYKTAGLLTASANGGTDDANGAALTYAGLVQLRGLVEGANARSPYVYVMSAETKANVYTKGKYMDRDIPIIEMDREGNERIDTWRVVTDNSMADSITKGTGTNLHSVFFGAVHDVKICPFSALRMDVDPYSEMETSGIRVYCRQALDVRLQHGASLAAIVDAVVA